MNSLQPASRPLPRQTILIDADDTLWENNIYFERAIASFISLLDHAVHTPDQVRAHLNQVECQTIAARGYGTESFRLSLVRCFEELADGPPQPMQHARIMSFVDAIVDANIELIDGVREALLDLSLSHRLILVTKGNDLEQRLKLERSGLAPLFDSVEVLQEKDTAAYRQLGVRHALDPRLTWMVGNSPKSDINPALEAGFHAVFIPHADTWILEHEHLAQPAEGQHLLVLTRLADLAQHLQDV